MSHDLAVFLFVGLPVTFVPFFAFLVFVRVCHWIHRRYPGSLADRIRAYIADEDVK